MKGVGAFSHICNRGFSQIHFSTRHNSPTTSDAPNLPGTPNTPTSLQTEGAWGRVERRAVKSTYTRARIHTQEHTHTRVHAHTHTHTYMYVVNKEYYYRYNIMVPYKR